MFKGPVGFGRFVNLIMNILLCAALSLYVLWYNQQLMPDIPVLTPLAFAVAFAQSMFVGLCFGAVVPGYAWGQGIAAALGIKNQTAAHVVACIVHAFIMVSMISFICGWLATCRSSASRASSLAGSPAGPSSSPWAPSSLSSSCVRPWPSPPR